MDQRPRAITHGLVSVALALQVQAVGVAFGGLVVAQVDYARDHDDQEDHAPDYDAGDCAGGDAAHAVVEEGGGGSW